MKSTGMVFLLLADGDLSPMNPTLLGLLARRSDALSAEYRWLIRHLDPSALDEEPGVCPDVP